MGATMAVIIHDIELVIAAIQADNAKRRAILTVLNKLIHTQLSVPANNNPGSFPTDRAEPEPIQPPPPQPETPQPYAPEPESPESDPAESEPAGAGSRGEPVHHHRHELDEAGAEPRRPGAHAGRHRRSAETGSEPGRK